MFYLALYIVTNYRGSTHEQERTERQGNGGLINIESTWTVTITIITIRLSSRLVGYLVVYYCCGCCHFIEYVAVLRQRPFSSTMCVDVARLYAACTEVLCDPPLQT